MIDRLNMFMVLARERHFGRAAEALGITQPSLSSAIKALEDQMGVRLVRRGSRYQDLTPEGERVLDWARRIVGDARAMQAEMLALRQGVSGRLTLGVIPTATPRVGRLIDPFLQAHPHVSVTILLRSSDEIRDQIHALELDAGITYLDGEAAGRMQTAEFYRESYCLIDSGGDDGPADWADAARRPLCLLTPDMQNRRIIDRHLTGAGHRVRPRVETNSMLAILSHVATGNWAAILPRAVADGIALPAGLRARSLPDADGYMVGLVVADRSPHPPVVEALLRELRRAN